MEREFLMVWLINMELGNECNMVGLCWYIGYKGI